MKVLTSSLETTSSCIIFSVFIYVGDIIRRDVGERWENWINFCFIGISYQNGLSSSDLY